MKSTRNIYTIEGVNDLQDSLIANREANAKLFWKEMAKMDAWETKHKK